MKNNNSKLYINIVSKPKTSELYDVYWKFACKRQDIFLKRLNNEESPWTDDAILSKYKFTNAYRASDRVSQFLIKNVIYNNKHYSPEDMFFRIIFFKIFNKIETWQHMEKMLGEITFKTFDYYKYDAILMNLLKNNKAIYSAAYIMPSGTSIFKNERKHRNHLMLIEKMMRDNITTRIANTKSLKSLYELLLSYPTIGNFLAFQYSIDINYSNLCDFDEMSFVVTGPGAKRGIQKCFSSLGNYSEDEIIKMVCEKQSNEFQRLNLSFRTLWGRPLQLIDCQNLFCEVDKYTRVAYPNSNVQGKRIKQIFKPDRINKINYYYPPKWGLKMH